MGFERRITIVFTVEEQVTIIGIFYGGRDFAADLDL